MTTLTFDTLKFANRLKAAGVSPGHAEAEAEALSEVFEANTSSLVTKQDLRELEMRMTIKLGSIMVIGVGLMVTLSKLIH